MPSRMHRSPYIFRRNDTPLKNEMFLYRFDPGFYPPTGGSIHPQNMWGSSKEDKHSGMHSSEGIRIKDFQNNRLLDEEDNSEEQKKKVPLIPSVPLNRKWGDKPEAKTLYDEVNELNKPTQPKPQKTKSFTEVAEK